MNLFDIITKTVTTKMYFIQ